MKLIRLILIALVLGALPASLALAWDITHEGHHVAHVGSPVRITLAFKTVPNEQVESLKIYIDGVVVPEPEVSKPAAAALKPGHGEITFVYHPDKRGQHRVELVPEVLGTDGKAHIFPARIFVFLVL
jgi:hypothetical protein